MSRPSPAQFLRQVRQEVSKVTWPSRKETGMTTAMVFVLVFLFAIYFLVVDWTVSSIVLMMLGLGS